MVEPTVSGSTTSTAGRGRELARAGALIALEAEPYIFGGERVAVVEREPPAQLELVREPVAALRPRLCQAVADLLAGERTDESVVDRVEHSERRDLRRGSGRIEPAGSERDVEGDRHVAGRRLTARRLRGAEHERSGQNPGHPAIDEDVCPWPPLKPRTLPRG